MSKHPNCGECSNEGYEPAHMFPESSKKKRFIAIVPPLDSKRMAKILGLYKRLFEIIFKRNLLKLSRVTPVVGCSRDGYTFTEKQMRMCKVVNFPTKDELEEAQIVFLFGGKVQSKLFGIAPEMRLIGGKLLVKENVRYCLLPDYAPFEKYETTEYSDKAIIDGKTDEADRVRACLLRLRKEMKENDIEY